MNGHDMNTMYPQFTNQGGSSDDVGYGDSGQDDYYNSYDDEDSYNLEDELFAPSGATQQEDKHAKSSSTSSSPAKALLAEALAMAQGGKLVAALPLFERAARLDPSDPIIAENLGVNLMRLGLLNRSREQLHSAKQLRHEQKKHSGGSDGGAATLESNLKALMEHEEYAREIEHDADTVYEEHAKDFAGLASGSTMGSETRAAGASVDGYVSTSATSTGKGRTYSFAVDLSRPLGTGIDQSARIDSVVDSGQFAQGGAAVGDQVMNLCRR